MDLDDVGVFLAERAVANECRETQIEQFGKGTSFICPGVRGASTVERSQDVGQLLEEV